MKLTMHSRFVIDTYAWVEYLLGSRIGGRAKKYIEDGNGLTPTVVLAELRRWYLREIEAGRRTEREMQSHFAFVESVTQTIPLDSPLALKVGETDFFMRKRIKDWPLADSVILATARSRAAQVVSGDSHFKDIEDVIFIG